MIFVFVFVFDSVFVFVFHIQSLLQTEGDDGDALSEAQASLAFFLVWYLTMVRGPQSPLQRMCIGASLHTLGYSRLSEAQATLYSDPGLC